MEDSMADKITYSKARAEFSRICSKVAEANEVVYITRRKKGRCRPHRG
jgi:hypothetical protein